MCGYEKPNYLIIYLALLRFVAGVEFNNLVSPCFVMSRGVKGYRVRGKEQGEIQHRGLMGNNVLYTGTLPLAKRCQLLHFTSALTLETPEH